MSDKRTALTVGELIAALKEYPADAAVRIAHQPQWPFGYEISGVVSDGEVRRLQKANWREECAPCVWLVEGALDDAIDDSIWRAWVKKNAG